MRCLLQNFLDDGGLKKQDCLQEDWRWKLRLELSFLVFELEFLKLKIVGKLGEIGKELVRGGRV